MNITPSVEPAPRKQLRLWLGVVAVVLWLLRFVIPVAVPPAIVVGMLGALVGALAVIVWWAFFSRAPRLDRWGGVLLMIAALLATSRLIDKSIATGMMGFMFASYALPVLAIAFAVWATFSRRLADGPRRASMVATILLACGGWTLLRTNGITGEATSDFAWRWSKTHEERLVAQPAAQLPVVPAISVPAGIPEERLPARPAEPVALPAAAVAAHVAAPIATPVPTAVSTKAGPTWPGFRGPGRDSIIPGTRIASDWSASPPVELWRRPVGPGWGSFAVSGDLLYTQEQRGDDEIVACYNAATGKPVWAHRDGRPARADTPRAATSR